MKHTVTSIILSQHDHPAVNAALISLGLAGIWIPNGSQLQSLYFLLLIGPAAWHCFGWVRNTVWPALKKLFKKE